MNVRKVSPVFISGILLALFVGIALFLRVYLPYDKVFTAEGIKFTANDAYYFMRMVDNLVHNFPHHMSADPYFIYPNTATVPLGTTFFEWLLSSIIWVIGLGSPTQHTIDVVGAYFPAVLGALTIIPVYFIGKELMGRWAGWISAGLLAILPGEFLGRSILGFTDYHIAETLFTTVTMMFLLLAIKAASQKQLTFNHLNHRDWAKSIKPLIYSLLAGISLGIYLLTWQGALLFVFIISIYFIIQFTIDHLKGKSTDYLCIVGVILFFIATVMFLPASPRTFYTISMVIALFIPIVLSGISRLMASKKIKSAYYPLTLIGAGAIGIAIFYLVSPALLKTMLQQFGIFTPTGVALTTIEMQPILAPSGTFSLVIVWGNFTTSFFLSLICLGLLIYQIIKQGNADKSLFLVWSLVILAAAIGQRRFAYYLAVNVALLTGYLSAQVLNRAGFVEPTTQAVRISKNVRGEKVRLKKSDSRITVSGINMVLALVIIFLIVFLPNVAPTIATASETRYAPSDAWCSSLSWMKENTPDPLGNPDIYNQLVSNYQYPKSAYGIMAWWDYGYWITRIAHRIPNANPSQDPQVVTTIASFFISQDEKSANKIIQEQSSKYIIIDYETAYINPSTATGKFPAIAIWAGKEMTEFFDVYFLPQENQLVPRLLYHPEYYRSLSTRLYCFDGKAVTPGSTIVISYQENKDKTGNPYKVVTSAEQFDTYEEAETYLSSQNSTNYKIVGTDPFVSPVPLEALEHYQLIHSSNSTVTLPNVGAVPAVKIFEYTD